LTNINNDFFLVFLFGHGLVINGGKNSYFYVTSSVVILLFICPTFVGSKNRSL